MARASAGLRAREHAGGACRKRSASAREPGRAAHVHRRVSEAGQDSPHLDEREQRQAARHAAPGPVVIHEIVREEGQAEISRGAAALAWSGLAAGLSIGFSAVAEAYMRAALPDTPWRPLVAGFGYCLGFLIVVLGRQQLFTETTLTALIPALTIRTKMVLLGTVRVYVVVLCANLVGTWLFAAMASRPGVFSPEAHHALSAMAAQMMALPFWQSAVRSLASGWLIGLMVWLLPASGSARPLIVILLTYVIAMCEFPHVVAGSVEAAFAVCAGQASIVEYGRHFLAPVLLGNLVGGTALAALLNHAPVAADLDLSVP